MHSTNRDYWSSIISPHLRSLIPGITHGPSPISTFLVEREIPFVACGDFVWAVTCIAANAPREHLEAFRHDRPTISGDLRMALLWSACDASDFYGFPPDELSRLFKRLNRNLSEAPEESEEFEAHTMIRDRIEDVILYLAIKHPRYEEWLASFTEKPKTSAQPILPPRRGQHLRLVHSA